jgi:LL-diaminopimelate aminotransferase
MHGTFYVWVAVPAGFTSASLVSKLLQEIGVVATPGQRVRQRR